MTATLKLDYGPAIRFDEQLDTSGFVGAPVTVAGQEVAKVIAARIVDGVIELDVE